MATSPDDRQRQKPPSPKSSPRPSILRDLLGSNEIVRLCTYLFGIVGALTSLVSAFKKQPVVFSVGVAILLLTAAWHLFNRWRLRRLPAKLEISTPEGPRAYLRGLLPFERGEKLLGRDGDIQRVITLITSADFRFGYLSGEAGSGKTSLLRAGVVPQAEQQGLSVVYVPRPGLNPQASLLQALTKQFPGAVDNGDTGSLLTTLFATVKSQNIQRLLIIWDQFEEFLIANPTSRLMKNSLFKNPQKSLSIRPKR
ncbi:MAG: ATP-binding protein [Desulfobaccales bacterium]